MEINTLIGKTLSNVENTGDEVLFTDSNGDVYKLWHSQDCCERVKVEDVCGDLDDLVGTPILSASEESSRSDESKWPSDIPKPEYMYDSWTWTFYKLRTHKGSVTIRFLGESNGYYSEAVDFDKVG